ncbi:hypothetical protein GCM10027168_00780 [Streptomyces capparidis]
MSTDRGEPMAFTVGGMAVHADRATYDALTARTGAGRTAGGEAFTLSAAAAAAVHAAVHEQERRRARREHVGLVALLVLAAAAGLVGLVAALLTLVNAAAAFTAGPAGVGLTVSLARRGSRGRKR